MLAPDFLNLQCVQLKAREEWKQKGEQLSFVFPKGGVGKWIAGSNSQQIASGDVLVLNAALGGKVCVVSPGGMDFWFFALHLEHLFPLFESSEICLLQNIAEGYKAPKLYPAATAVAQECHRRLRTMPLQVNLDYRSHLLQIAAAVLTDEFSTATTDRVGFVRPEEHMIQVFKKLTAVELLSFSVGELAKKFGCSRRHLNRLFHHYFGVSVAALRMEMRLLRSVTLLRDPDAKVIRVAEDCGFNHLGLFNTCFKRRFGASPGQWRRLNLKTGRGSDLPPQVAADGHLHVSEFCPLCGNAVNAGHSPTGEIAKSPNAGPATYLSSQAKAPRGNGKGERHTAAGPHLIRTETKEQIATRIFA